MIVNGLLVLAIVAILALAGRGLLRSRRGDAEDREAAVLPAWHPNPNEVVDACSGCGRALTGMDCHIIRQGVVFCRACGLSSRTKPQVCNPQEERTTK